MPRHFLLKPKQIERAREMRSRYVPFRDIAKSFGVSVSSVVRACSSGTKGPKRSELAEKRNRQMAELREQHMPVRKIAQRFGVHESTVIRAARNYGEKATRVQAKEARVAADFVPRSTRWDWDRTTEADMAAEF